jgi:hypothetical protein
VTRLCKPNRWRFCRKSALRVGFDGDNLAVVSGCECQRDREGADMGADVENQIASFDEAS